VIGWPPAVSSCGSSAKPRRGASSPSCSGCRPGDHGDVALFALLAHRVFLSPDGAPLAPGPHVWNGFLVQRGGSAGHGTREAQFGSEVRWIARFFLTTCFNLPTRAGYTSGPKVTEPPDPMAALGRHPCTLPATAIAELLQPSGPFTRLRYRPPRAAQLRAALAAPPLDRGVVRPQSREESKNPIGQTPKCTDGDRGGASAARVAGRVGPTAASSEACLCARARL